MAMSIQWGEHENCTVESSTVVKKVFVWVFLFLLYLFLSVEVHAKWIQKRSVMSILNFCSFIRILKNVLFHVAFSMIKQLGLLVNHGGFIAHLKDV